MNGAAVTRGVVVYNPRFLSICGTDNSGPSPATAGLPNTAGARTGQCTGL